MEVKDAGDGYGVLVNNSSVYEENGMGDDSQMLDINNPNSHQFKTEQEMIDSMVQSGKANEIGKDDLNLKAQIGNGQFGKVYKAIWESNVVVVKQLNSEDMNEYEDGMDIKEEEKEKMQKKREARMKEMHAEIELACDIPSHNCLVQIYGYTRSPFGVVMSYMPGDSVQKFVYRNHRKSTDPLPSIFELLIILRKAASGLKHLHKYGLVHRNIACRNILLGSLNSGKIVQGTEVRISDFGLTRQLLDSENDTAQKTNSNFGPIKWMAPESIRNKEYNKKSDVFMFGMTMWEIFYGMEPYQDMTAVSVAMGVVNKKLRPSSDMDPQKYAFIEMPDLYDQLMNECWAHKPDDRPPFAKVIINLSQIETNPRRRVP